MSTNAEDDNNTKKINNICRNFCLDQHPEQLKDLLKELFEAKLSDVACLIQSLVVDTVPTKDGGDLLGLSGKASINAMTIPYHMYCFLKASDVYNNYLLNNSSLNYTVRNNIFTSLDTVYKGCAQGTNYWDPSNTVPTRPNPKIVITMTTCKRLVLFIQTVQSFLSTCKDIDMVDAWYTIDDNSCESDRATMKEMFPWMNFIWKTPEQRGHAKSMNMLREAMPSSVEYILHMEDDWKFLTNQKYITKSISILDAFPDLGQILFNIYYAEDPRTAMGTSSGIVRGEGITTHVLHEHHPIPDPSEFDKFWPHFSLRPGVIRKKVWDTISFDEKSRHFEMTYAHEYITKGWVTGFFNSVVCVHIGRRVNTNTELNAYELNGEIQFKTSEILPLKFVEIPKLQVNTINRILKRSHKLRAKNWYFAPSNTHQSQIAYIICKNLNCVDWDVIIIKKGPFISLRLTDQADISEEDLAVVVAHNSIDKFLNKEILRVYICYI